MTHKTIIFWVLVSVIVACGEKKQPAASNQDELDLAREYHYRDSTLYGACGEGSAMNSLQLITDNGDTLLLSTIAAQDNNRLFGGYEIGDRMAVIADADKTKALTVINLNTLMGEWVMPNPLDGSSYSGFNIKDGGIMESINQSAVIYKTWQIENGRLTLVSVREGGGDFTELESFDISYLTNDSLALRGSEEIFEYNRPGKMENYDDLITDDDDDVAYDDIVI